MPTTEQKTPYNRSAEHAISALNHGMMGLRPAVAMATTKIRSNKSSNGVAARCASSGSRGANNFRGYLVFFNTHFLFLKTK